MVRLAKLVSGTLIVTAFVVGGVLGTDALIALKDDNPAGRGGERQPTRVAIAAPVLRTIAEDVTAVGTLRPARSVLIAPNTAGRVAEVLVESGQHVAEGDLLIQLDDRAARAAVAETEATLREAEQDYRRFQQLQDSNAAAEARLEEARGAFLRAEAAMMTAQSALEDRAITAPFAGTIGLIDLEPGAFLMGGDSVARLSDLSQVQVSVSLPERYFERVSSGQSLEITTPAYPGETFEGRVTVRTPEIDLGTRSFEIRAEIENSDGKLVGGMFANSRLVLDTYDAVVIPDDAVISEGLATFVYTVSDGNAVRTVIELGAPLGAMIEVRQGLETDTRVVVAGWDQLSDGAPVEIDEDFSGEGLE